MKRSLLHQSLVVERCIRGRENVVCNLNYSEKRLVKSDHRSKTASLVLIHVTTRLPETPSESKCFQWIRWTPSDDFPTLL